MENKNITFKTNVIKDKLLLHDAVEMEKQECKGEYASYIKYHSEQAIWYKNIENYLDELITGHEDATTDEFIECIYNMDFSLDIIEDIIGLKNNPLFKKAVGIAAIKNIEELEDYIYDYFEEYDDDFSINNKGQTFNYYGRKVKAVKTSEELGVEVANLAEKINLLKDQGIISDTKVQEFQKLLFDIYEYYLSVSNGEQLDFPKISDKEYKTLEKEAYYQNISMERQLMNLIRNNKNEFKDIQNMQQEYYEKNKKRTK